MSMIEAMHKDELEEGASTPGITRHLAFKGENNLVLRSRGGPGIESGWHHHGDYEVFGFVVSGSARFVNGSDPSNSITVGPGDFFHVPPNTVHREINPSKDEGQEIILLLQGTGPMVVNVDGPEGS